MSTPHPTVRQESTVSSLKIPNPAGSDKFFIMEMLVLLGLGHFLKLSDEEMTPVSALPEIMGLGGVRGKLTTVNNCSLPASAQEKIRKNRRSRAAHS